MGLNFSNDFYCATQSTLPSSLEQLVVKPSSPLAIKSPKFSPLSVKIDNKRREKKYEN